MIPETIFVAGMDGQIEALELLAEGGGENGIYRASGALILDDLGRAVADLPADLLEGEDRRRCSSCPYEIITPADAARAQEIVDTYNQFTGGLTGQGDRPTQHAMSVDRAAATSPADDADAAERAFRGVGIEPEPARRRLASWLLRQGIVVALAAEILFFWSQSENFMTTTNIELVLVQISAVASSPRRSVCCSSAATSTSPSARPPGWPARSWASTSTSRVATRRSACSSPSLSAAGVGVVQGALATKLTLSPIIITLGFYTAVRGLVFVVSDGKVTNRFGQAFHDIGRASLPGIGVPMPVSIAGAILLLAWLFHTRTKWGRHVVGLGVNAEAARRAGISLEPAPVPLLRRQRGCAGLAAVIIASRLDAAPPTLGDGLEIDVLSAVLLGGVAFGGGQGLDRGCRRRCAVHRLPQQRPAADGRAAVLDPGQLRLALVAAAALEGMSRYLERRRTGGAA